jgi:4,5-DOPA dioxygenase extradiol
MTTAPSVFFAHGSPMSALGGDAHAAALHAFGEAHRDAAGIVIVSAHWQKAMPINVTSWESAPLIYDFGGFPEELNRIKYPAQGDAALAARIDLQLHAAGLPAILDPGRGLDHGAWVPQLLAWPDASIPVVQVSLPTVTPRALFALGEALRPLREDGVIVAGSGGIVHNLRRLDIRSKDAAVEPWATEFDEWVAKKVETRNLEDLFRYHTKAPNASRAVPTSEHFDPIFVTLGAALPEERPQTIYTGFHYGTISMRSFAFGA